MKCPNCNHVSETALFKCSSCGMTFDHAEMEKLEHLEFLLAWLDEQDQVLGGETHARLRDEVLTRIRELCETLLPTVQPFPTHLPEVACEPEELALNLLFGQAMLEQVKEWLQEDVIGEASREKLYAYLAAEIARTNAELAGRSIDIQAPSEMQVLDLALEAIPGWVKNGYLYEPHSLRKYLENKRTVLAGPLPTVPPEMFVPEALVSPAPKPIEALATPPPAPPKPVAPPIDWGRVWARAWGWVVSGALLRGLLYLGAFMIVVSAIVLVIVYWRLFPPFVQLGMVAALPLSFYLAGISLRTWLKIPMAGGVFIGIGALLVAVDLAAVYQLGGLASTVDLIAYWFIASVICTIVYAFTAWRLPGEFFGYITLVGASSAVLALTQLLRLPLEWGFAAVAATGAGMVEGAARVHASEKWNDLVRATRRLPIVLLPIMQLLVLFVSGNASLGQAVTFGLASVGYGLMAWRFPRTVYAYATVWSSLVAVFFGLRTAAVPWEWYPAAAALLAPLYIFLGHRIAGEPQEGIKYRRGIARAAYSVGFTLVVLALAASSASLVMNWWAGVIALTIISLVLAWCGHLFHFPVFVLVGSGLFIAPYSFAIGRWLYDTQDPQLGAWLMAAWAGLALVYLGIAVVIRKADQYGIWLNLWAQVLAPLTCFGLLLNAGLTARNWVNGPTLIALGGVLCIYVASSIIHDSGDHQALDRIVTWLPRQIERAIFLWPIGLLFPIWLGVLWTNGALERQWLGVTLAGLALAFVGLGGLLARRKLEYRVPLHVYAYALSLVSIAVASGNAWAWLIALCIVVVVFFALAFVYRRVLETGLTVLTFTIAFAQALAVVRLAPGYDAVAWVGLAYAYVLIERALGRVKNKTWMEPFCLPLKVAAVLVWTLSLALTLGGTAAALAGTVENYLPLVLAQALAAGLTAVGARLYRTRLFLFLEPWLGLFPVTLFFIGYGAQIFGQELTRPQYALVWIGFGAIQLVVGALIDRAKVRYSHGLYIGGYGLCALGVVWSASDALTNVFALGASILIALGSQVLVHAGRHLSFDDFVHWVWRKPDTPARRTAQTVFLFFTVYAFPLWLAQLFVYTNVPWAWRGFGFALCAPIYLAIGLAVRRIKAEYTWPWYSAAYALTAIGAMVAFDNELIALYVLTLDAVVYAVSAYIFRQAFWLYLSTVLVPVIALIGLHYRNELNSNWVTGIFMGLAFAYFGIGQLFARYLQPRLLPQYQDTSWEGRSIASFALPFYAPGYLLSAVALAVAGGDRFLALYTFSAGVVLYALSAWVFRESLFLYPAVWLVAVPYFIGMTLTGLPAQWHGVGWLALIVFYIAFGKLVFHKRSIGASLVHPKTLVTALAHPAMPFYILAYVLSVHMLMLSQVDALVLTIAYLAGAVLYFGSAALFRRAGWIYPGLLAIHMVLVVAPSFYPSDKPAYYLSIPFLGMTWLVALVGYAFSRRSGIAREDRSLAKYLTTPTWAQPFFVIAALDVIIWQVVALNGMETAILLATGNAVLLALFSFLWQDARLPYGALAFSLLAVSYQLSAWGIGAPERFAWIGGIGLALYIVGRIAEQIATSRLYSLSIWVKPLTNTAIFLTALAIPFTLLTIATNTTASAAALAFAGALYLAISYRGKYYRLGYLGLALIEAAWILALIVWDVSQPQLYAIPAGLYFIAVGYLERRRARRVYANIIEIMGLAVLLLTSFIQSLNGAEGFVYFVLLLVEALLVIWWGAARRIRIPFFIGIGASTLNVVAQVAVLVHVYDVNRFIVIFGVGLLLVIAAVFVERQRAHIIARTQEWREALEVWG